jgi:hypothetical protein
MRSAESAYAELSYHQHNGLSGPKLPVVKVSFATKVRYLGCGAGYYKQVA